MEEPLQKTLLDLEEDEFKELWKRLRVYTYSKYGVSQNVPGIDLEDQIMQAILDTHNGIRRFPPIDKQGRVVDVSLCAFLCMVIRSNISHILERNSNIVSLDQWLQAHPSNNRNDPAVFQFSIPWLSAADETVQQQAEYKELSDSLRRLVDGDPVLTQIVNLLIASPDLKPGEIAKTLGLSRNELRNAQRRLTTKTQTLKEAWRHEQK